MGPPQSGLVDLPISDRYEIGCSQKMVRGVIFGVEHLILVMKSKRFKKIMFLGYMRGRFGALVGPSMVKDGRYAGPR